MAITTILFDCDNTLVLSEPLAFAACADLSNAILDKYAPATTHRYTGPALQREFVGKNFRALIAALEEKHGFSMPLEDVGGWVDKELGTTVAKIKAYATPCEGSMEILRELQAEGKYQLAVVSSSALPRVLASIEKTGQDAYFPSSRVFSAASMIPPTSKPDPAVYLHACRQLGLSPSECVAIEDSRSGATAAKRAGIPLMGYVGPYYDEGQAEVDEAEKVLKEECGAKVVMHHWKDFRECMRRMEA
jgi:beta-phosphoglucomutase-like phosphatase (HAD superfamily)